MGNTEPKTTRKWGRRTRSEEQPTPPTDAAYPGIIPPKRSTGSPMNLTTAVSMIPVYRSLQILATVGGQIELTTSIDGRQITSPPLVASPDVNLTPSRFVKRSIVSLASTGNCYWRKFRFTDGTIASYEVLNPLTTRQDYDKSGKPIYRTVINVAGQSRELVIDAADVRHLKLLEVPGFHEGLGPIQAARTDLAGIKDTRSYASNWFGTSGIPNGVLSSDATLTPQSADENRKRFTESVAGHTVAVLGHGLTYEPILLKPEDAQWIASRSFDTTEVARLFGVPASYLLAAVEGSTLTYQNLEQVDTQFVRTTLMAYLTEIEDAISADLPGKQKARFNLPALLRSDNFTRAKIHGIYLDKGVVSPEYVAELEGYPIPAKDQSNA